VAESQAGYEAIVAKVAGHIHEARDALANRP
jgi:hypothetical protein